MAPGAAWNDVGAGGLRPEDFSRPDHMLICRAIAALAGDGKPHDIVTVREYLERHEQLVDAGGFPYLSTLVRDTPTADNARAYAQIVRDRAVYRKIQQLYEDSLDDAEFVRVLEPELARLKGRPDAPAASLLEIENVAQWVDRAEPAPRDWVIAGLIPGGRVTSLLGNGGLGKTTVSASIAAHVAGYQDLYGLKVAGGSVLGIFCEDEREEIERRIRTACTAQDLPLERMSQLHVAARDGRDNIMCTFERDQIVLTEFYREIDATVAALSPRLVIIDTAADVFAGDFMSTPHVRQFIKHALGGLCVRYGCAVLLVAHPSSSGMSSGDGSGFSTAWNNSVRSRLYLRRPKTEDGDAAKDRRVLEVRKSNYAADGLAIPLIWSGGGFILDNDPIEETARITRAPKHDTRLAVAVLGYFRSQAAGSVVTFGALFEKLQGKGELPAGVYETVRKPLQRTLKQLQSEGLIAQSNVPRGYRLTSEAA